MQEFADWLRSTRRAAAISQDGLAQAVRDIDDRSGVYQARVTAWEHAKDLPSFRQLTLLGLALQLDPEVFRTGRTLWDAAQLVGLPDLHGTSDEWELDAPTVP